MTNTELVLNMLAEAASTEIHQVDEVHGLNATKKVAKRGAGVAKTAREALEGQTGRSVLSAGSSRRIGQHNNKRVGGGKNE
jgi:hypothetical protein